jgi:hypothetical protein
MNERMVDLDIELSVENVPTSVKTILQALLQLDGTIFKAELLEMEYRISVGIQAEKKDDVLARLKTVGEVAQLADRQTAKPLLRAEIRIVEK